MNLFVYGTLLFPEIRNLIGGRIFESQAASITGFEIFRVKDAHYPGVIRTAPGMVTGQILGDITEEELDRFDQYEGESYQRSRIEVRVDNSGEVMDAWIYEIPEATAGEILSDEAWTKEWFAEFHHREFLGLLKKSYGLG